MCCYSQQFTDNLAFESIYHNIYNVKKIIGKNVPFFKVDYSSHMLLN